MSGFKNLLSTILLLFCIFIFMAGCGGGGGGATDNSAGTTYYTDSDGDGFGDVNDATGTKHAANPGAGWSLTNDDCDDTDASCYPEASEIADDGIDQDCNGYDLATYYTDSDGDGHGDVNDTIGTQYGSDPGVGWSLTSDDCNDSDSTIYAGASEVLDDGIDQDCNGYDLVTLYVDFDRDGYGDVNDTDGSWHPKTPIGGWSPNNDDCNDTDSSIHPGSEEIVDDGIDQDCNGYDKATYYIDSDEDGYGDVNDTIGTQYGSDPGAGWSLTNDDCDDTQSNIYPSAPEIADDGIDQDCNGYDLVTYYVDNDVDGYGDVNDTTGTLHGSDPGTGWSLTNDDCDDTESTVNPGSEEICYNGIDDDCSGKADNGCVVGFGWGVNINAEDFSSVVKMSGGAFHSLYIRDDDTVWAAGKNTYGQLGDGTNTNSYYIPVQVTGLNNATVIAAGAYHSMAVIDGGNLYAWGSNTVGQLGDGTTTDSNVPVAVSISNVSSVVGGHWFTMALKDDGTVWAWGYNVYGQLGNGTNTDSSLPVQVTGLTDIVAIAAGTSHGIAVKNDGTVVTWGDNTHGQLGDGTFIDSNVPVVVAGATDVVSVSARGNHTMALKNDGTVLTWGYNEYGQLGNGSNSDSNVPVQAFNLGNVTAIAGGGEHSISLKNDGTVWAWGHNLDKQLGDGTDIDRNVPVLSTATDDAVYISGGFFFTLVLR